MPNKNYLETSEYISTLEGKSANPKIPLILEEEKPKEKVLYIIEGEKAINLTKEYVPIDKSFSIKKINEKYDYSSIFVDLDQNGNN